MAKDNFLISSNWGDMIKQLPTEDAGILFQAIFELKENPEYTIDHPYLGAIFSMIKTYILANEQAYKDKCSKNANNRKGNKTTDNDCERPSRNVNDRQGTLTTDNDCERNATDNDNDSDNDNDKKNNIPPISPQGEKDADSLIAEKEFSPEVEESVRDWIKYKKEKRQGYKSQGLKSLLTEIKNNVDAYGDQAVIDVIRKSMSANYQGITWNWLKNMPRAKPKIVEMPPNEPEEPEMTDEEWAEMVVTSDVFGS